MVIFPYYGIQYLLKDPRQRKLRYSDLGEYIDFMGTPVLCLIADTISFILCFAFLMCICLQAELPTDPFQFSMGYEYILWACVVGQIYTETIQLRKLGWKNYVTHFWNVVDILIIIILLTTAGIRIYTVSLSPGYDNPSEFPDSLQKHISIAWILYGILGFLQTIKFLSLTDANNVLGPLQLAMKSMIEDLLQILVLLIFVQFGFSVCIYVVMRQIPALYPDRNVDGADLGNIEYLFSDIWQTYATLFWALFGFIDFIQDMRMREEKTMAINLLFYLVFAAYLMMSAVLLLNMLIAMLTTTFERIQHQSGE